MRTVWKYQLPYMRSTVGTFWVPEGARLVHVEGETINPGSLAEGAASLWFEVDTEQPTEARVFEVFGTGHIIPETGGAHAGTVVAPPLVLHVYERLVGQEGEQR